jgi:hypothetical protein
MFVTKTGFYLSLDELEDRLVRPTKCPDKTSYIWTRMCQKHPVDRVAKTEVDESNKHSRNIPLIGMFGWICE